MNKSKTSWAQFDGLQDKDIDYSDVPELDESFFKNATLIVPKNKKLVTLRLDEEVINFFKAQGPRYQTRMNSVLLTYARAHQAQQA